MSSSIRVGVVGAGQMGTDHVKRLETRISGAHVAAIVEPDPHRGDAARSLTSAAVLFTSIDEVLSTDAVDALLVATPGQFHEPVLLPALEAGLPVLCEKPLTPDSGSALRVLDAEQRLSRPHVQLGFMRRFDPEYCVLREHIACRASGELLMLRGVHRNPSVPDSYRQEMLVTDSLVHELDVIPWLAGSEIVSIEIRYPRRNSLSPTHLREPILALIELADGVLVDIEMNVSAQFGYQVATEAVFEKGIARIGQPSGLQSWNDGRFSVAEHVDFTTRFAAAYDSELQSWIDAVHDGSLVDGPNAWDGYRVALASEAGVAALSTPGAVKVGFPERPAFYG